MSDCSDIRATLTKEINSVLISAGTEITLKQLERDYKAIIGHPIQVRDAGFTDIEDLIMSMRDAVSTRWENGVLKVKGLPNENNMHVASLISRTKKKSIKAPSPRYPTKNYRNIPSLMSQNSMNVFKPPLLPDPHYPPYYVAQQVMTQQYPGMFLQQSDWNTRKYNSAVQRPELKLCILRGQIKDLMFAYPMGLKDSAFPDAFARRFGSFLSLEETGFPSYLQLFQSMSEILDIEFHVNNRFTLHSKLLQKRQSGKGNGKSVKNPGDDCKPNLPERLYDRNEDTRKEEALDNVNKEQVEKWLNGDSTDVCRLEQFFDDKLSLSGSVEFALNEEIQMNVKKVLSYHPNGLYASKFLSEYRRIFGKDLVLKRFGFQNMIELIADMPEIADMDRPTGGGDWLIFDKRTNRKRSTAPATDNESHLAQSLMEFKELLQKVLMQNPDGVLQKDLESVYARLTNSSINPRKLGFANIDRLLEAVDDSVEIQYLGEGRVLLKMANLVKQNHEKVKHHSFSTGLSQYLPPPPPPVSDELDLLPVDACQYGVQFTKSKYPEPASNYLEVIVSEVVNPDQFWFQFASSKNDLEILMDDIQKFYLSKAAKSYIIPDKLLKVGLACVALFDENGDWHRAVILEITNESAKIFYVDYGTVGYVYKKSLRLIKACFMSRMPALAISGCLSRIAPVGESWTTAAVRCFVNLVVDRILAAKVTDVSKEPECIVSLCLCDTSGNEELHINDHLIQEKHAVLVSAKALSTEMADECSSEFYDFEDEEDSDEGGDDDDNHLSSGNDTKFETNQQQQQTLKSNDLPCSSGHLFKFINLTLKYSIHLINIDEKAYVISTEVSFFFWEDDIIRQMLRIKFKTNVSKLVITQEEHPQLLQQLIDAELPGTSKDSVPVQLLVLYELKSVVDIVEFFNHPSEDLKIALQRQVDMFNPQDSYWTGKKHDELVGVPSDFEQRFRLEWSQFQKQRETLIIQMKLGNPNKTRRLVEAVEEIEAKLEALKTNYKRVTHKDVISVLSAVSDRSHSGIASVDHVVSQQDELYLQQNAVGSVTKGESRSLAACNLKPVTSEITRSNGEYRSPVPSTTQNLLFPPPPVAVTSANLYPSLNTTNINNLTSASFPGYASLTNFQNSTLAFPTRTVTVLPGAGNPVNILGNITSSYPPGFSGSWVSGVPVAINPMFLPSPYESLYFRPDPHLLPSLRHFTLPNHEITGLMTGNAGTTSRTSNILN